jgi:hypothetical protein
MIIDMSDFTDEELIDEVKSRGLQNEINETDQSAEVQKLVNQLWLERRSGKSFDRTLDQLIYCVLGKIV